jgi:intein/homing endonuclease
MRLSDKKFRNKYCQECIKKAKDKYGKFNIMCDGITVEDDVKFAVKYGGMTEEDARYLYDPASFFEQSYGSPARDYQIPMLQCTSRNLVARQCRQTGKTLVFTNKILHFVGTNPNKTVLILAPQEKQVKKIWDEYIFRDGIDKNAKLKHSVVRKREKPYFEVVFDNGSKIMLMIAGPGARGQCMPAGQLITMHDGSQKPIEEVKLGDIVLTFDENDKKIKPNKVTALHNNGERDIYEVVTNKGRSVKATGNHPFYINDAWIDAEFINKGDLIAVPAKLPTGNSELSDDLIKYAAYMLDNKSKLGRRYSTMSQKHVFEFNEVCKSLNIIVSRLGNNERHKSATFDVFLSTKTEDNVKDFVNKIDIARKKDILPEIENLPEDKLTLFLNRLFSNGGNISYYKQRNSVEVWYHTKSNKIASKLQYMLQRLGIKSRIDERKVFSSDLDNYSCKYILRIENKREVKKFLSSIGIYDRGDAIDQVSEIINYKNNVKEDGDFYYEKVKSCKIVGREETYNLTIESTHTFIANGIITHNTADWVYVDESAIINNETLKDILMTIASRGDDATILLTSTPMGRGNIFYEACKENSEFNEYFISIDDVPEMAGQKERFRKLLGEKGYIQEALAQFPSTSGGPFNLEGISMAKLDYEYENARRSGGMIYFGGVDWNGPAVGTYFYIIGFNPNTYQLKVMDKAVVSSANWNSTVAKKTFIDLNRKWEPKHWMVDYGYSQSIVEELTLYSMNCGKDNRHPDSRIKHIIEPVAFGSYIMMEDPFTKEEIKKTTKSFIVSQVARVFEPQDDGTKFVPIAISQHDEELVKSLEAYKLLQITSTGQEKFGLDPKDGYEDHAIDAFILACYGVIKHYNTLFKRIIYESVSFKKESVLEPLADDDVTKEVISGGIILLTDNSPEPIYIDEGKAPDTEEKSGPIVTRSFNKGIVKRKSFNDRSLSGIMRSRGGLIRRNF